MDEATKIKILDRAKTWMREEVAVSHKRNTLKLANLDQFSVNPFLSSYLANCLEGNDSPESIAKALIYPRVLSSSITTIFGTAIQKFITQIFDDISGSTTSGIDLEFVDMTDGRRKYCQLKAGPNVVNKDGALSVANHFRDAIRLARTNNVDILPTDFIFCLIYGEKSQENAFIKGLRKDYVVATGKDFWTRLTGDEAFYQDLIHAIGEVAVEYDMRNDLADIITKLADQIRQGREGVR